METRSRSKVKGKTSPPRAATVGGTQPIRDVFVDPPSSAAGLTGDERISPRSSSPKAGPCRTCRLTASSESAGGTRGPAQEVKNDENHVIVDSQSSEKVLIPTPDEGWNSTPYHDYPFLSYEWLNLITFQLHAWNGHCACAVWRGQNSLNILNRLPRFIHSLCHFQGATRKTKPCCWRKWRSSYCEGYKVYGVCVVSRDLCIGVPQNYS